MNLWIRTQNGDTMKIVYELCIRQKYQSQYAIMCGNDILGLYRNKNRALEVLDEIQNSIINQSLTVVYYMPKE